MGVLWDMVMWWYDNLSSSSMVERRIRKGHGEYVAAFVLPGEEMAA